MAPHAFPLQAEGPAMSFEEYLEAYDGVHAEWAEGRVYIVSPGNEPRGRLSRVRGALVQHWAEERDVDCREVAVAAPAPTDVRGVPGVGWAGAPGGTAMIAQRARASRPSDSDEYTLVPPGNSPRVTSRMIPGFWLNPEWMRANRPSAVAAYREWGLI